MISWLPKYDLCLCSLRIASMAGAIVKCKCLNDLAPGYLLNKLCTRSTIPSSRTAAGERAFNYRDVINMKQPEKGLETQKVGTKQTLPYIQGVMKALNRSVETLGQ